MQKRIIDTLVPIADAAVRSNPDISNRKLVQAAVDALANGSKKAFVAEKIDALLAATTGTGDFLSYGDSYFYPFALCVAMTGDRDRFEKTLAWWGTTANWKPDVVWENFGEGILTAVGADELDPSLASDNVRSWSTALGVGVEALDNAYGRSATPDQVRIKTKTYEALARGFLINLQPLVDRAIGELSNGGPSSALFDLVAALDVQLDDPPLTLDDTKVDLPKRPNFFIDSFPIYGSRSFEADQFDLTRKNAIVPEKTSLYAVLRTRGLQAKFLSGLYGQPLTRPKAPPPKGAKANANASPATLARQAVIKALPKPVSVYDPAQFALLLAALFVEAHEPLKKKPDEALAAGWEAATKTIEDYLDAFAKHPGLDMTDKNGNFLETLFPRTIAGEELHDCGVYANWIAFWLLQMEALLKSRNNIELGLTLSFVFLPAHVGLITRASPPVLGKSNDGLPTLGLLITHNNHFNHFPAQDLKATLAAWVASPAGEADPPEAEKRAEKFIRNLAASKYISETDMPVFEHSVLSKGEKPTAKTIWKNYKPLATTSAGDIFGRDVNTTVGKLAQFWLKYVGIIEDRADFINKNLLNEFWRTECPFIFVAIFLTPDPDGWNEKVNDVDLEQYHLRIVKLMEKYQDRLKKWVDTADAKSRSEIKAALDAHSSKIVSKIARRAFSERFNSIFPNATFDEMKETLDLVAKHTKLVRDFIDARRAGKPVKFPDPPPYLGQHIKDYVF